MKKIVALLLALAMLICMCACQKKEPAATEPTEATQATTQPTETQPETVATEPVDPMIAVMQGLLGQKRAAINNALLSVYETPADVDLFYLFYNGFLDETQEPVDDEMTLLLNAGAGKFWPEMDLIRLPVEKMDLTLTEMFGITLEQTNGVGLDKFIYLEETNCYYTAHTGMEYADITIQSVSELEDGSIVVSYSEPVYGNLAVTLIPTKNGGYHIFSNVKV